jgi:ABC-type multidrug transport system fused ATPase/permease subunit
MLEATTTILALPLSASLSALSVPSWKVIQLTLVVAAQFRKKIIVEYRAVRKINSKITGTFNENIIGVRVVKALCREDVYTSPALFATLDPVLRRVEYPDGALWPLGCAAV